MAEDQEPDASSDGPDDGLAMNDLKTDLGRRLAGLGKTSVSFPCWPCVELRSAQVPDNTRLC